MVVEDMAGIFRALTLVIAIAPAPSFGKSHCANGYITEDLVSMMLDHVNIERQKVANGQRRNAGGDFLPPPLYGLKNLTWSCDVENDLQSHVRDCTNFNSDLDNSFGISMFDQYFTYIDKYPLSVSGLSVQYSGDENIRGYAKLIHEKATTIGCVYYECPNMTYVECDSDAPCDPIPAAMSMHAVGVVTNDAANLVIKADFRSMKTGDVVYTVAELTTTTSATTKLDTSTFTLPTTTTATTKLDTSTSTSTSKVSLFSSLSFTTSAQKSTSTEKFTTEEAKPTTKLCRTTSKCVVTTTCKPARNQARTEREAAAKIILKQDPHSLEKLLMPIDKGSQICPNNVEMADTLRMMFLNMHNYRRLVLSLGKLKKGGKPLPQAKNMMRLVYDCHLEELAVKHAKRCPLTRSQKPGKMNFGENFYRVVKVENASLVDAVVTAVDSWWNAGETTDLGPSVLFQKSYLYTTMKSFTQMAWATTKYLGCSVVDCQSFYVCICNYSPRGNIVGKSVYKPGHSCSECGPGATCEAEIGLCV